jgi:glycosyltransferase involved in cell wall biosynthesis
MIRVVHTESSSGWGGQEMRILSECALLNQQGHFECSVVTVPETQMIERGSALNVPIHLEKISHKRLIGVIGLIRVMRQIAPDVVITHSSTDSWLVAIARYIASLSFRMIRIRHVSAPIAANRRNRWLYHQSDVCVTTSEAIRRQVICATGMPSDRVLSVPTGVDAVSRFVPVDRATKMRLRGVLQIPHHQFVALMVSTLRSWKGHRFVFDALRQVPDCHLVVLGDGPQSDALRHLAQDLDVAGQISFRGYVSDVEAYMQAADAFLQPSTANEGVSQALLQAGACQLPVIVSDIGGLNEVVVHRETGLLVSPGHADEIAASLIQLMRDSLMASKLGEALREKVTRCGSDRAMAGQMAEIIRGVVFKQTSSR